MKSREPTVKKISLLAVVLLSAIGISIGGHISASLDHLHFSEFLFVAWFTVTAPGVLLFTFHDIINGRSLALLGGIVLVLSALFSKTSKLYGSSTLENLAIITHNYNLCELLGTFFIPPSYYDCNNVTLCIVALIFICASRFDIRWLPVNWQDDFICANHLTFTALLYYSIPSSPPLSKETIKEPRLRLGSYAAGFVGVQLVIFGWLQFRSSFASTSLPSNPWYALIASLAFVGLNFIWLPPALRTLGRVLKENQRILKLRELDASST